MRRTAPRASAFDDVPRDPRGHLGLYFHWATFRLIHLLRAQAGERERAMDDLFEAFPFLTPYWLELVDRFPETLSWNASSEWFDTELTTWEETAHGHLPLRALQTELGWDRNAVLALVLAGAVEEDPGFGTLFAQLQGGEAEGLSATLLHDAVQGDSDEGLAPVLTALVESGLCEVPNRDAPRPRWQMRVARPYWDAIRGRLGASPPEDLRWIQRDTLPKADELTLGETERRRVLELIALVRTGQVAVPVVRGTEGSQRTDVLLAVARSLGKSALLVPVERGQDAKEASRIGVLAVLTGALPIFELQPGPGEAAALPSLAPYTGPVGVTLGRDGGLTGRRLALSLTLELPPELPALRAALWAAAFGEIDGPADEAADRFTISAHHIRQSAAIAISGARMNGRSGVVIEDVRLAVRALNHRQLDTLATRLPDGGGWNQLVVHPSTASALGGLQRRCRFREQLPPALGDAFPGGLNRGVRALFEGPSGTGKTLAARILGAELGRDVYRVDLASVVNKYIGETEKNLSKIFGRAEELDVVLLLDEGDALLTRRTEVRSANDRYANLETNYLLQRLESYLGVLIVTTNAGDRIDPAFRRRMDASVRFYAPDPGERLRLWDIHLSAGHALPQELLQRLATIYELTGGQIRNASVHATLSALDRGAASVDASDVLAAIEIEYRKAGAVFPSDRPAPVNSVEESVAHFLAGTE